MMAFTGTTADLPGERSLYNSAATLAFASQDEAVKADCASGIMLYGSSPAKSGGERRRSGTCSPP